MNEILHLTLPVPGLPGDAPGPVVKVALAWAKSAMTQAEEEVPTSREFWASRLYVYNEDRNGRPAWVISDNYGRSLVMVYYPSDELWTGMYPYGEESPMRGGTMEALSNAEIMWTG